LFIGRHAVRVLFEKGSSVLALSASAPLKEAESIVRLVHCIHTYFFAPFTFINRLFFENLIHLFDDRNKFQIGDDVELEWSTLEGSGLDPNVGLALQLKENDWVMI
jgi:hypothetical protein